MTARDLLQVVFRRRAAILTFMAAVVIGVYASLRLISPTYEAQASLLVKLGQEDIYMPALPSSQFRTPVMSVIREEQLRSEASILTDPALARQVIRTLGPSAVFPGIDVVHPWYTPKGVLQRLTWMYNALEDHFFPLSSQRSLEDKAVSAFQRAVKAEALKSSNTLEVSMRNKSPDAAALTVNTLVNLYLQERVRIHQREQSDFFARQLAQLDRQLKGTEEAVESYRSTHHVSDLDQQRSAQIAALNDAGKRLDDTLVAMAQQESRAAVLKQQLQQMPATMQLAGGESANNLALSELNKQLADVARREADIRQRFSDLDPRLEGLAEERKALMQLLQDQQAQRVRSSETGLNPAHARIRDDLLQTEAQLAGLRRSAASLKALQQEIEGRLERFNRQDAQDKQLTQQLDVLRSSRQLYLEKQEEARLAQAQAAARLGNVSIISAAARPTQPVSPKLWMVLVGALAGALLGGLGLAFLLDQVDDRIHQAHDIVGTLGLPLLAKVPELAA